MKTIEEYAKAAEGYDVMQALELLTKAYVSQCGVSISIRTILFCAAEVWQEKLAWMDLPLSEMARKTPLIHLMPYLSNEYNPEMYDRYDITGLNDSAMLECCQSIIQFREFDEPTKMVLCYGILKAVNQELFLGKMIETTASDGTPLVGTLWKQSCCKTWLTMQSPYENVEAIKWELVRDEKELLKQTYSDYNALMAKEKEVRALYPQYQKELKKCTPKPLAKSRVFRQVYDNLLKDYVLFNLKEIIHNKFGLEFYDSSNRIDPSWY